MSNAFSGVGTTLQKSNDGGSNYTTLAEVKSISGPEMSKEMIDTTSLDSTGGFRTFVPSFKDGGNVSLELFFTRTGYEDLLDDFLDSDNTLLSWIITLPDGQGAGGANTQILFDGHISDLPMNITFDDAVSFSMTIKVSGEPSIQDEP